MASNNLKSRLFLSLLLATLISILMVSLIACDSDKSKTQQKATSFVAIDINPSVELILDQNNMVMSVSCGNTDANVMLYGEDSLVGLDVSLAVDKITRLAIKHDFLTDDNNAVSVAVTSTNNVDEQALFDKIKNEFVKSKNDIASKIDIKVQNCIDIVLQSELEHIKSNKSGVFGYDDTLTVARYKLIKKALMADKSLCMDEAVTKSNEALAQIVDNFNNKYEQKFGSAYIFAVTEAELGYKRAKQALIDSALLAYAPTKNIEYSLNVASYTSLKAILSTLEHNYYLLLEYTSNPIFDAKDLGDVINLYGNAISPLEFDKFKTKFADDDGNFDYKSTKDFLNKLFRNATTDAEREEIALVCDDLCTLRDQLNASASANIMSSDETIKITASLGLAGASVDVNLDTTDGINRAIQSLDSQITDIYAMIVAELSKDELAEIVKIQTNLSQQIAQIEKDYIDELAEIEKIFKEKIEDRKSAIQNA